MRFKGLVPLLFVLLVVVLPTFGLSIRLPGSEGPAVKKESLANIPLEHDDQPLAVIRHDMDAWVVLESGRAWRVPLDSLETARPEVVSGEPLRDVVQSKNGLVWMTKDGVLGGAVFPTWKASRLRGSRLEADPSGGLYVISAEGTEYFSAVATQSRFIPGMSVFSPTSHGFFWALTWDRKNLSWALEIRNDLGQLLKQVYTFSRGFRPAGCRFAPRGPEEEVLLSAWRGSTRELMLIGQNGKMFWKIAGPEPCCARDLAWDTKGNLLVLEREGSSLRLSRWSFAIPQG